jgi:DNA-binding transcriptional MocR family regulator
MAALPLVDAGTLVLHGLRLKGFAETDVLSEASGLDDVTVVRALEGLAAEGLVRRKQGIDVSGWVLTAQGRAEHEKRLAAELDATGARPEIEAAYGEFSVLNPELLQLCTDWQLRPEGAGQINDHTDAAYDAAVVDRLQDLHRRALPVVAALAALLPRFGGYPARLQHAADRVGAGDRDWFTRPMIDSYHTVWFELHEDLLATLGLQRADDQGG